MTTITTTSQLQHLYRDAPRQELCAACREPAVLRCSHCGRTLCDRHGSINACCPDCELAYSSRETRVMNVLVGTGAPVAAAALTWVALTSSPILLFIFAPLAVLCGLLTGAVTRQITRRRWIRGVPATELLDGVQLPIIATESPQTWRRGSAYESRPRGETPTADWGMRTYGR